MKSSPLGRILGRRRTEKSSGQKGGSRIKDSVRLKTGNYQRVPLYILVILVWTAIVIAYISVLERAVRDPNYLGARGSKARDTSFDVIGFIRTTLATIHVPLIVSVLASTIPYWTMTPLKKAEAKTQDLCQSSESRGPSILQGSYVMQLFYLADRDWAGLIGWLSTLYNNFTLARPSLLWLHLTVIVAFAYSGFPLLSVAYTTQSLQYWDVESLTVASSPGRFQHFFSPGNGLCTGSHSMGWPW